MPNADKSVNDLMDVGDVSRFTGLSPRTIYNLVSTERIPYQRVNAKKVLFDKNEIDAWMKARRTRRTTTGPANSSQSATAAPQETRSEPVSVSQEKPIVLPGALPRSSKLPDVSPKAVSSVPTRRSYLLQSGLISLALVTIAALGGWLYLSKSRVPGPSAPSSEIIPVNLNADLARINYLDFVPEGTAGTEAGGTVQIKLEYLSKPMEVRGQVQSPQIKSLLIGALKKQDEEYSIKSKSIDIVQPYYADPEIRAVLLSILARDKDPVIRMKAMTVLSKIAGNREIKSALIDRLKNDVNVGVRYKALELIEKDVDDEILGLLRILKDKETNRIIRDRAGSIYEAHIRTGRMT